MARTDAQNIQGEWKYGDVGLLFSSWNPIRWSNRMSLARLAEDVYNSSERNRPIVIRFHNTGGTLLLEKTYDNDTHARDECLKYIKQDGLEKTTQDSWDPLGLTGPEGHGTNMLKYVPLVGHAVNLTHYAAGKTEVANEGDLRVSNTTAYVPVLGHAQAACTYMKNGEYNDLAQKSLTRSTGVTAGAAVGWAAAPAATATMGWWIAQAAVAGGASAAAGNATQRLAESQWVEPKNYEKADKGIDEFLTEVSLGVLTGVLCEVGFAGFNTIKTSAGFGQTLTREIVEEVGEQSIRISFKEGSTEVIGQAMQQAAAEGATEEMFRTIFDNCFVKAGVTAGFMDTPEYRLLKDKAAKSYSSDR